MSRKVTFSEVDKIKTIEARPDGDDGDEEPLAKRRLLDPHEEEDDDDGDEEEEEECDAESGVDPDNFVGGCQEKGSVHDDDGIKITPFNLTEELEDGHFDTHGNFIFNKSNNIRDNWIDNVDWEEVRSKSSIAADTEDAMDQLDRPTENRSIESLYAALLPFLHEGETVLQAIRRLGGAKAQKKGATRPLRPWEKKKMQATAPEGEDTTDMQRMLEVTELADVLLQAGEFDIYQETKEKIAFRCKGGKANSEPASGSATEDDNELDRLAASFDGQQATESQLEEQKSQQQSSSSSTVTTQWEVKMDAVDDTPIEGPFTSEEMLQQINQGKYATSKALVRKVGTHNFSSIHRIDFELYID